MSSVKGGRTLSRATIETLRDWGISRREWVAEYGYEGLWWGDRCGCPDDRCIGHHHDEGRECWCVVVLSQDLLAAKRSRAARCSS